MHRLSFIKDKLTWPFLAAFVIYIAALVIFFAVLLPYRNQAKELETRVEQLAQQERDLLRIVAGRPSLEERVEEARERLLVVGEDVPSQYDLPGVQDVLTRMSVQYGLTMNDMDHVPLQAKIGDDRGVIPLTLQLLGDETLLSYLAQVDNGLPTLVVKDVVLTYLGARKFQLDLQADLHVLVLEQASLSNWVAPSIDLVDTLQLTTSSFGLSFQTVAKFLEQKVRVLGVVEAGKDSRVLLLKDGARSWYRPGDRLDEAVVSSIFPGGVWLNVDGVQLKLTTGS